MKFQVGVTKPVVEPASELASLVPLRYLPPISRFLLFPRLQFRAFLLFLDR